jgi:cytochrome c-type biogenesis protein CcsB
MGLAATAVATISWALLALGLIGRGLAAGHWPLTNRYEFALCLGWTILSIHLLAEEAWYVRQAGVFMVALAATTVTWAITRPASEQAMGPLLPALRSIWLQIHVLSGVLGYGAFAVAAALGAASLAWPRPASEDKPGELAAESAWEWAIDRTATLGFLSLTASILAGAIWAQRAWGRYWGWDPKETWALVTWLWYLLVLHVRPLRRWRGRRLAWLALGGLGMVLLAFIGVPWLVRTMRLESLHGF